MPSPGKFPAVSAGEQWAQSNPTGAYNFYMGQGNCTVYVEQVLVPSGNQGGFAPAAPPSGLTTLQMVNSSGVGIGSALTIFGAGIYSFAVTPAAGSMVQLSVNSADQYSRISVVSADRGPGQYAT